jgi:hypothetical protein
MALLYPGSAVQISRVTPADRAFRPLSAARRPPAAPTLGVGLRSAVTAQRLACASVLLNMLVSASLLYAMGISYTAPGGNPLAKLHPGTYLLMLAFALMLWERHTPLVALREYWRRERAVMCFLLSLLWCVLLALIVNGPTGTAVYIESFAPAALLTLILGRAPQATLRRLGYAMLALFALSVVIALLETTLHERLMPMYLGGDAQMKEFKGDFRGTGLWDHPLTGASMTMIAMVLMLAMPMVLAWRAALALLFLAGLISFGGRTALLLTVVTLAGYGFTWFARQVASRRLRPWHLAAVLIALVVVPLFLWAIATQTPAGERLVAHLYWDESAQNRAVQLQVLDHMTPRELFFGANFERIVQIIFQMGLSMPFNDIEDFWLVILTQVGIFGFIVFVAGFLPFVQRLWKSASAPGRVILLLVLLIASTSNSLGRKSNLLTIAVATVFAADAFRRPERQAVLRSQPQIRSQ